MNAKKKIPVDPGRLRLVKMSDEDPIEAPKETPPPSSTSRSAFVRGVSHFADDLDRMIEQILKS